MERAWPYLATAALALLVIVICIVAYRRGKRRSAEKRKAYGETLLAEQKRLFEEIHALSEGRQADLSVPAGEVPDYLERLKRKLAVNKQALFDFEAQSHFPVPQPYRKPGYIYAKSKRSVFITTLLSVLPGLGHFYVGQWQKGVIILVLSICIDFFITPALVLSFWWLVFVSPVLLLPVIYRCIVFTDLEMIRQKMNRSIPVRPFEFF
jgi:TM2 domain-containing membrane protein YozV